MSTELVRYDAMCRAIAEAHQIDEVKEIHDKAAAMQQYARQARNTEMERHCVVIRIRAERKAGELLREKAHPGHERFVRGEKGYFGGMSSDTTNGSPTLDELGISRDQSSKWQKLAAVPESEFEAKLRQLKMPSTNSLIKEETERREKMEWSQEMEDRSTIIAVHNALAALSAIERRYVKDVVSPRYLKGE